jgi:hypothetical protein
VLRHTLRVARAPVERHATPPTWRDFLGLSSP